MSIPTTPERAPISTEVLLNPDTLPVVISASNEFVEHQSLASHNRLSDYYPNKMDQLTERGLFRGGLSTDQQNFLSKNHGGPQRHMWEALSVNFGGDETTMKKTSPFSTTVLGYSGERFFIDPCLLEGKSEQPFFTLTLPQYLMLEPDQFGRSVAPKQTLNLTNAQVLEACRQGCSEAQVGFNKVSGLAIRILHDNSDYMRSSGGYSLSVEAQMNEELENEDEALPPYFPKNLEFFSREACSLIREVYKVSEATLEEVLVEEGIVNIAQEALDELEEFFSCSEAEPSDDDSDDEFFDAQQSVGS